MSVIEYPNLDKIHHAFDEVIAKYSKPFEKILEGKDEMKNCINCQHLFRNPIQSCYECHIEDKTEHYIYKWITKDPVWIVENPAEKNADRQCKDFCWKLSKWLRVKILRSTPKNVGRMWPKNEIRELP